MPTDDSTKSRVIIIEDEPMIALYIEDVITEGDYDVIGVAHTLDEAEKLIATVDFDVVILDVSLHGQKTDKIAEALSGAKRPFIVATGAADHSVKTHNNIVVAKPYTPSQLIAALGAALADHGEARI